MTARGFQDEAKKNGAPWFLAKSFDTSCPVSSFINKDQIPNPHDVELFCRINGKVQQEIKTNSMLSNVEALIAYITKYAILERGDIIVTGTLSGVGRVKSGDSIQFGLTEIKVE
uniref:FAA_hydrolase domain-containing protein n=1 Tax=Rhabditophanes sp. KR3021 TaxID=114890 RepID=A0AC35UDW4_9BILA